MDVGGVRVDRCDHEPVGDGAMWVVGPRAGTGPLHALAYGVAPPGWVSRQGPLPLVPGCYLVTTSGTGRTSFDVAADGTVGYTRPGAAVRADSVAAVTDTLPLADVLPLLERVDAEHAALLRANPGPVTYTRLPFYAGAGLLRAAAHLGTHPVVARFGYAPAARRVLALGTPERVRAANAALGLRLTAPTAVAYLNYYLEAAGGPRMGRRLVERAGDVPWMPDSGLEADARTARDQAGARVHPARVRSRPAGGFTVDAVAVRGAALESVRYDLSAGGHVGEPRVALIADGLPIVVAF